MQIMSEPTKSIADCWCWNVNQNELTSQKLIEKTNTTDVTVKMYETVFYFPSVSEESIVIESIGRFATVILARRFMTPRVWKKWPLVSVRLSSIKFSVYRVSHYARGPRYLILLLVIEENIKGVTHSFVFLNGTLYIFLDLLISHFLGFIYTNYFWNTVTTLPRYSKFLEIF